MSGRMFGDDSSEDEDEDFGGDPVEKKRPTNLGSLFHGRHSGSVGAGDVGNLQYTAPKQPSLKEHKVQERQRESTPALSEFGQPRLLFHSPVHAFALKDGQFIPQGKVGLALLAAPVKKEVKMLLYMSNKKPLSQSFVGAEFTVQVQREQYVLFKDDRGFQWSVAFDNSEKMLQFLQWVLTVRSSFLKDHAKEIISVDVIQGEGQGLSIGDSVEIEYQEYLIEEGPAFSEFNGNLNSEQSLKVKIGKGKVPKGWEQGMLGMKKGGKRLFLLPPDIGLSGHDSSPTFPTDAPIMVLIHVKRLKFSRSVTPPDGTRDVKNAVNATKSQNAKGTVEKKTSLESVTSEVNEGSAENFDLGATGETPGGEGEQQADNESLEDQRKADLLSRIAKIGKPTVFRSPDFKTMSQTQSLPTDSAGSSMENSQNLPHLPDFPEEISDSRKNSWEKPQGQGATNVKKTNPLAIVCADLSMSRSGSVTTSGNSKLPIDDKQQGYAVNQGFGVSTVPQQGAPVMPFMYPYPHNPYFAQFYPPGAMGQAASGHMSSSSASSGSLDQSATALSQQQPMPFMYPFPPFTATGLLSNMEIRQQKREELSEEKMLMESGLKKEILDEIQRSQIQLQDALTKLLSQNLAGVKSQMSDICEKLEDVNLRKQLEDERTDVADKGLLSQNSAQNILEKLDKIGSEISELKSRPDNREDSLNMETAVSAKNDTSDLNAEITAKLETIEEQMRNFHDEMKKGNEWREKYEKLKSQALLIKDKYEERINLLNEQLLRAQKELVDRGNEEAKIKKIMSQFYKSASSQFDNDDTYDSEEIKKIILGVIKETTLQVLQSSDNSSIVRNKALSVETSHFPSVKNSPALFPKPKNKEECEQIVNGVILSESEPVNASSEVNPERDINCEQNELDQNKNGTVADANSEEPDVQLEQKEQKNEPERAKSESPVSVEDENLKSTESSESFFSAEPTPEREFTRKFDEETERKGETGFNGKVVSEDKTGTQTDSVGSYEELETENLDFEDSLLDKSS